MHIFSIFSEWAAITPVIHISSAKDPYAETNYYFMGKRVNAGWKPRNWSDKDLTISRLSPIQTRALCASDINDLPHLIQEAKERIVLYKTERPAEVSLMHSEHVTILQTLNVWQLRLEYLQRKYSTAIPVLWPEMKRSASPPRRRPKHLRPRPARFRAPRAHRDPLGGLSLLTQ